MVFVLTIVLLVVIAQNPQETLWLICITYAMSGPIVWVYKKQIKERRKDRDEKNDEPKSSNFDKD
jgi:CDP-diacylglycerol--serine O-phosphatidyltransferase